MVRTIAGGILGGFALFVIRFLFWQTPLSALAFHRAGETPGANLQAALAQALTQTGTGVYIVPDPATAQGTVLYGKGPIATIFYNNSGFPVTDPAALISGLILAVIVGIVIALALRFAATDFGNRARIALLASLAAVLWLDIGQAVFNHAHWGFILYLAFSDFIALAATGLIAARLIERAPVNSADATTMH
jgi:hypothetical protein